MSETFTPTNGAEIGDPRPALVLDTNTVLALWMFRDPALDALRDWIEAGNCRLYSREDALEELRRVLGYRQFGLDAAAQKALSENYCELLTFWAGQDATDSIPPAADSLPRCRDPDDQKFLEIASLSAASHLLTRDKDLLRLNRKLSRRKRLEILRPEAFAELCTKSEPAGRPK